MKKRNLPGSIFILLEIDIFESSAFRDLSTCAQMLYVFFKRKRLGRLVTAMLEPLPLSYAEINKALCISFATSRKAILELESHGFIDCVSIGGLRGCGLSCNVYRLSDRFKKWGAPEFVPGTMKKDYEKMGFGQHRKFRHEKKILKISRKKVQRSNVKESV